MGDASNRPPPRGDNRTARDGRGDRSSGYRSDAGNCGEAGYRSDAGYRSEADNRRSSKPFHEKVKNTELPKQSKRENVKSNVSPKPRPQRKKCTHKTMEKNKSITVDCSSVVNPMDFVVQCPKDLDTANEITLNLTNRLSDPATAKQVSNVSVGDFIASRFSQVRWIFEKILLRQQKAPSICIFTRHAKVETLKVH